MSIGLALVVRAHQEGLSLLSDLADEGEHGEVVEGVARYAR